VSTPQPEADAEYSRGAGAFRAAPGSPRRPRRQVRRRRAGTPAARRPDPLRPSLARSLAALAALGALILAASELAPLFAVTPAAGGQPVRTVTSGPHHHWALLPLAGLAFLLAVALWRTAARAPLLPLGLLGVIALVIALAADLPSAQASGLLRVPGGGYALANAGPKAGMYMETLGAITLIIAGGAGLLLGAPASRDAREGRSARSK
jgi:hypothetical protein